MILVVEDNKDMQALIRIALKDEGFEIRVANDGTEALQIIDAGQMPSLIFLDSNMDCMNGAEFLKHLEARFPDNRVAVVSMSGSDEPLRSRLIVGTLKKPVDLDSFRTFASKYSKQHSK